MKTVIIGGGKGCRSLIKLATGTFLKELIMNVQCVMDLDYNAQGMIFARNHGIATTTDMQEALSMPGLELVIELTGIDRVLDEIYKLLPPGTKLVDHTFAHVFWDLVNAQNEQANQLNKLLKLERKIERERFLLQKLFDTIPDLVLVLDREGRIVRINARVTEFTGISQDEAIGRQCYEVLSLSGLTSDKKNEDCSYEKVLKTGQPNTFIRNTPPPNESHWQVTQYPIMNPLDESEAILETWYKITETVLLKREIEVAEQRFRSFIDSAQDMISIKDRDGKYILVNPATASAFHLSSRDFLGKTAFEMLPPDLARIINQHDREVINTAKHRNFDEIIPVDGRDRQFNTMRFPLTDYGGNVIGVCTIARDISRERELQSQLVRTAKLAAVGKLAAGVAHEINNPLTGILAFAEDIHEELTEGDPHRDDMQVIIRETLRCREIVRNLLDFARQDQPVLVNADINQIIDQSLLLVERLPDFRDIVISKDLKRDLPQIKADAQQLQQVILNFMLNAAEAMKLKGKIFLETKYDRKHDKCIVSVEDNGPGIPENLIDKIFEPFFSTKGTNGLGLAVSWGIVERHKGSIEIDMAESGGAIFRIIFPVAE